jgi:hypothetical protein
MSTHLLDNASDLAATIEQVTRARMAEGDSAGEVGPHIAGAVLDLVLPVVAGDLLALDLIEKALALVDWGKVAQTTMYEIEGVNPWKV